MGSRLTRLTRYAAVYARNRLACRTSDIFYIAETADWVIRWEGLSLARHIERLAVTHSAAGITGKVVHFGTNGLFRPQTAMRNRCVLTYYHVAPEDPMQYRVRELSDQVDLIHTSCRLTEEKLLHLGANREKLRVIPIPVDLDYFKPLAPAERTRMREQLSIPPGRMVIGSFQKDGVGWDEGLEPKLVKGPDVLCDVLIRLSQSADIHVLLTGPSRGYVMNRLRAAGVPYSHVYVQDYLEMPKYYGCLDLYLVTSREEGGPKGILDSMACGVPVVSTRVGQAADIIEDGRNGLMLNVDDAEGLTAAAGLLLENRSGREKMIENGRQTAQRYSLRLLAQEYFERLYRPLLG